MKACSEKSIIARAHSIETFGTHEGPGIRFLLFLQGCLARCLYCQNPDTWDMNSGFEISAREVFEKMKRCLPYINSSGGGITVSGGEPLLHVDFLAELFLLCKKEKVHTAIDTSAFYDQRNSTGLGKLIRLTDLFIVDVKAGSEELHRKISSRELSQALGFLRMLEDKKKPYWIRYVLVPGLNDSKKDMESLSEILSGLAWCRKFEFLPYHTLGKHKWKHMGLSYPLDKTPAASAGDLKKAYLGFLFKSKFLVI